MLTSREGIGKNQLQPGQVIMGDAPVLSHLFSAKTILDQNRPVYWSMSRRKINCFSPFFGVFPSDHIPKAKKDVNILF
jgi:hypothetical protein